MITFGAIARRGGAWLPALGIATLAGTLAILALPTVLGRAVDAAVAAGGGSGRWIGLATGLIAVAVAADLVEAYAGTVSVAGTAAWLRERLVRHVLAIGPAGHRRFDTGDLVSRVSGNAVEAAQAGVGVVTQRTELLAATLAENLTLFADVPRARSEAVPAAARRQSRSRAPLSSGSG